MALTVEERKARRQAGMERANEERTEAQKLRRALVNGRPPASELKTPGEAITAAKVLYKELESRLTASELKPKPKKGDWAVSIGYVSPDFSFVGYSPALEPGDPASPAGKEGNDAELMKFLTGHIMLGLLFAIVDRENSKNRVLTGARPFLVTKQTGAWLDQLAAAFEGEL